ncbi:hypothetical protein CRE_12415 [Caenorhabditis remanei]|uniref:G protein-coupled receptor n=1 Tax=Caenorhabditis remanei TaxID=31234 RepID=E3NQ41_CAERE|nr:hypothetical protein CRE_12415 [Caenorhabditis remanei]
MLPSRTTCVSHLSNTQKEISLERIWKNCDGLIILRITAIIAQRPLPRRTPTSHMKGASGDLIIRRLSSTNDAQGITWCTACAVTVSLLANQVIVTAFGEYDEAIEKKIAYSSLLFIFYSGDLTPPFTPTVCYNSAIMAWIASPLSEEFPSAAADKMYENPIQSYNNWIFLACIFTLFSIYFFMVKKLAQGQKSKASRAIFIQCSIICFWNTGVALVYNALVYVTPSPPVLIFAQICWAFNHACPAVIYMTMNSTIRREYKKIVFGIMSQKVEDGSTVKTVSQTRI